MKQIQRNIILSVGLIGLLFSAHAQSAEQTDPTLAPGLPKTTIVQYPEVQVFKDIIETGLAARHNRALEMASAYAERNAKHPCGYFALGLVHEWIIEPQEPEPYLGPAIDAFEKSGELTQDQANEALNVSAGICRGAALMRLARIYYKYGETFKGVRRGIAGAQDLEATAEKAPNAYDIYAFLGPYHYFTDRAPAAAKLVMRLFGLKGNRDQGIRELKTAWDRAPLFGSEAGHVLYSIHAEFEGNFESQKHVLEALRQRYPENIIYQRLENKAIRYYEAKAEKSRSQ